MSTPMIKVHSAEDVKGRREQIAVFVHVAGHSDRRPVPRWEPARYAPRAAREALELEAPYLIGSQGRIFDADKTYSSGISYETTGAKISFVFDGEPVHSPRLNRDDMELFTRALSCWEYGMDLDPRLIPAECFLDEQGQPYRHPMIGLQELALSEARPSHGVRARLKAYYSFTGRPETVLDADLVQLALSALHERGRKSVSFSELVNVTTRLHATLCQ